MSDFNSAVPTAPASPGPAPLSSPDVFPPEAHAPREAFVVTVDAPDTTAPSAYAPPPEPKHRRLRWLWWTTGSIAVASLAGLCAYLAVVAQQWSDRVDDLTTISQDLGTRVSDETAARQSAEANAATLQSQLDTATARITVLADEEANANDHESVWINLVDSLIDCSNGRQDLIEVLTNPRLYFPGKTNAQVENELTTYCSGLTTEYGTFKAEIGK